MISELAVKKIFLYFDAEPKCFAGWSTLEHRQNNLSDFIPDQIGLYQSEKQKNGGVSGLDLRSELTSEKVLNGNVLDYLFEQPQLIPETLYFKKIFFWGTIYKDFRGEFFVRYLISCGCQCFWGYSNLREKIGKNAYAAVKFSP
jgi:hypothetical protein